MNENIEKQESNIGTLRFTINEVPDIREISKKSLLDAGIYPKPVEKKAQSILAKNWFLTTFCALQVMLWFTIINYPVVLESNLVDWCQAAIVAGILFGVYRVLRQSISNNTGKNFKKVNYYPFLDDLYYDLEERFKKCQPMVLSIQDPEFVASNNQTITN